MRPTQWKQIVLKDLPSIINDLNIHFGITELNHLPITSWNMVMHGRSEERDYFVKIYNDSNVSQCCCDPKIIAAIQNILSTNILPEVVAPISTNQGQVIMDIGGYSVILYPWVDGHFPTVDTYVDCAQLLCKIHSVDKHVIQKTGLVSTRLFLPSILPEPWAENQATLLKIVHQKVSQDCGANSSIRLLKEAEDLIKKHIDKYLLYWKDSTSSFLHGDFKPKNILVRSDTKLKVFDFDCAQIGPPEIDLAYAALTFGGAEWLSGEVDEKYVVSFISNYIEASSGLKNISHTISKMRLKAALAWIPLRALTLSFKEEQIKSRLDLAYHMEKSSSNIVEQALLDA